MPAAAVASLTPSIGGISGNCAGASGEMVVDKASTPASSQPYRRKALPRARSAPSPAVRSRAELEIGENPGSCRNAIYVLRRRYFFGSAGGFDSGGGQSAVFSAGLSRRSILAVWRSLGVKSVWA